VRKLISQNAIFFAGATLAALALRIFLVIYFPAVVDDSHLYANIADNWLQHGIYGVTDSGQIMPTLSRLPGYPAFLAIIFSIFGADHFRAVLLVQILFDLASCFLIADIARRIFSDRAARAAFLLAAFCPFLANYAAAALTETLEIFFTVSALDLAICGLVVILSGADLPGSSSGAVILSEAVLQAERRISPSTVPQAPSMHAPIWLGCGLAIGAAILLRPDGGILLAAIGGYLLWQFARSFITRNHQATRALLVAGVLVGIGAAAPLIPWTLRNLISLHRFEPLAPRYANDSDEPVMNGFNRWTKTWIADYISVQEIYWNVPGEAIDASRLPHRAFDSAQQRQQTFELFTDYNRDRDMTPDLDARFATLAAERIHAQPLRYYAGLPILRVADMWLRPRTELFPSDPRWWEFNDDRKWLAVSIVFGVINLVYCFAAALGLIRLKSLRARRNFEASNFAHQSFSVGLFILFVALRSAFLGTLENPEPRYTLECYPLVIVFASALFIASHKLPLSEGGM